MKRYTIGFLLLLGMFLTVAGCDGGGGGTGGTGTNYHTGTQGLVMDFLANSPPATVYDGDSTAFYLEVKNEGASDATNTLIYFSGVDPSIVKLNSGWFSSGTAPTGGDVTTAGTIPGKSDAYPIGGYGTVENPDTVIDIPDTVDSYTANMKVVACYDYTTAASAQVCLDPDPTNNQDDACQPGSVGLSGGQGAPVAITNINTETSSTGTVRFTVTLQNVGSGQVIDTSVVSTCMTRIPASNLNVVTTGTASVGTNSQSVSCTPAQVRLVNGRGTMYCTYNMPTSGSAYITTFEISFNYGYKSSITKPINVRRI
jgi:hypothetical protein